MPLHELFGSRGQVVPTGSLSDGTIRNLIDRFGFSFTEGEAKVPKLLGRPSAVSISGIVDRFQERTGSPGGFSKLASDSIRDLINIAIDRFRGGGISTAFQEGDPIGDVFGFPDVIEGMIKGTLPRGAVNFIEMPDGRLGCPSGWHPEKSDKGYCVRNRRMNALNPRALSRASRRVGGFARAVKRARTLKKVCKTL